MRERTRAQLHMNYNLAMLHLTVDNSPVEIREVVERGGVCVYGGDE